MLAATLLLTACRSPTPTPTPVPTPTAVPTPLPTVDPTARIELPLGVQIFEADVDTPALDQLRSAGVAWARTRALWKLIEPEARTPARYDWTVTDRLFGDTTAAGFRNVAVVYANPPWAADSECGPVAPDKLERYAAFWTALVERYDGDGTDDTPEGTIVRYWQVSNEVDFDPTVQSSESDYGGCFGDDPARYADQLVVAYRAAKTADPAALIGFSPVAYDRFAAGSAPVGWSGSTGPFVYDFTQRAIEHLYATYPGDPGLPFFDFVAVHNYNDSADFWENGPRHELVGKIDRFRAEQLAGPRLFDLRDVPILISETGMASSPSDEWTERSDDLQAVYVGQTMVRALSVGVIAAIWYTARDNIFGDCVAPHYDWLTFGLMRSSEYKAALDARCPSFHEWIVDYPLQSTADPRPALTALATLTAFLRGASFDRPLTTAETGDSAIEAYRFVAPGGRVVIAAWTTNGQRLGKRGAEPVTAALTLSAANLAPWTGQVAVTDHLGAVHVIGEPGAGDVTLDLDQAPRYLAAVAGQPHARGEARGPGVRNPHPASLRSAPLSRYAGEGTVRAVLPLACVAGEGAGG